MEQPSTSSGTPPRSRFGFRYSRSSSTSSSPDRLDIPISERPYNPPSPVHHSQTRFEKKLALINEDDTDDTHTADSNDGLTKTICELSMLTSFVSLFQCPQPGCTSNVECRVNVSKRKGFAVCLEAFCCNCMCIVASTYTSDVDTSASGHPKPFTINTGVVVACLKSDMGPHKFSNFCETLSMPSLHKKTFTKRAEDIYGLNVEVSEQIFSKAVAVVKKEHQRQLDVTIDNTEPLDVAVSFDGTWMTRGHSSLIGIGCAIDSLTGLVVDAHVVSAFCQTCATTGKWQKANNPHRYDAWLIEHQEEGCNINYTGTLGMMEAVAAKTLWKRSVDLHQLRYTTFVGDSNSKAFDRVCRAEPYGPNVAIIKEECMNHVSKRLGTALRTAPRRVNLRQKPVAMSAGRPASAHMARKIRKKGSGKKKDQTVINVGTRRGSLGSIQGDRYHRTNFPLVMDLPVSSDDSYIFGVPMEASPTPCHSFHGVLPFQLLPDICKLKVWSFLKQCDLGRCMLVCTEWHSLIKKPHLWHSVQFSDLPYSCLPHDRTGLVHMEPVCHHCYRKRVFSFSRFLTIVRPVVNKFQFCFDISHPTDQFLSVVEEFISSAKLSNLHHADMNWKDSPSRQSIRDSQESSKDYILRFRRRQRMFVNYFEKFSSLTQHLTTLVVPFDWSQRSVSCLCRLTCLENLVLERYGIYSNTVNQLLLDTVLGHLVELKKLLLEVWVPTRIKVFSIESMSLTHLDLSQCRGFYLDSVRTPSLRHLRMVRQMRNNTIVWQQMAPLSCLLSVLAVGAPKLEDINGQKLIADWGCQPPEQLHSLMYTICCCTTHKSNSSIDGIM